MYTPNSKSCCKQCVKDFKASDQFLIYIHARPIYSIV